MSKAYWRILLFLSGGLALWWVSLSGFALWQYSRFSEEVEADVTRWEAVPKKRKYTLRANYTYFFEGKERGGTTLFGRPYHLNRKSAKAEAKRLEGLKWSAWVDPVRPNQSTLDRAFPWKKSVYAVVLMGVFLYFLFLKIHVEHLSNN